MKYGIDILTPTSRPDQDGWVPVMQNKMMRKTWDTALACVTYEAELRRQGHRTRLVELAEDVIYSN